MKKGMLVGMVLMASAIVCACGNDNEKALTANDTQAASATVEETENTQTTEETESSEDTTTEDTTETTDGEARRITPMTENYDLSGMDEFQLPVSFMPGDIICEADGSMQIPLEVYVEEVYDLVDVAQMKAGDTIVIDGQDVKIDSIEEKDGGVKAINGGLENGGYDLRTSEDTTYYVSNENDARVYASIGQITLPVSSDFTLTDSSNLNQPEKVYKSQDIYEHMDVLEGSFNEMNTIATVSNGKITAIVRHYMP